MAENLERIKRHIKAFQAEQESTLLKMTTSKPVKISAISSSSKTSRLRDDNPLAKYLDVDCFLLCGFASKNISGFKPPPCLWPISLVAQLTDRYTDLGNIETHGSLWRILKIDNGMSTMLSYVLQSSEIGEQPLYLTNDLELAESVDRAARWNIQIINPQAKRDQFSGTFVDESQGVYVQINIQQPENNSGAEDAESEVRTLVSAVSSVDGGGQGVAILTADQIKASYTRGEGLYWRDVWELSTEESSGSLGTLAGAEFLDEGAQID